MKLEGVLVPVALLWVAAPEGVALHPWVAAITATVVFGLAGRRLILGARVGTPLVWLCLLVAWLGLEALFQPVPWARSAHLLACGLAGAALALVAAHPTGRHWLRAATVAAGLLASIWLVAEKLAVGGRPGGPFLNPNLAGGLGALGLALLFHGVFRRFLLGAGPVLLAGVVASGSRAAALAVLILGFYAFFVRRQLPGLGVVSLFVLVGAGALSIRLLTDQDPLRFERVRIWRTALQVARAYFPWGAGPGSFADAALAFNFPRDGEFARFARFPGIAENDLLQVAACLGLPGVLLALGLGLRLCLQASKDRIGELGPLLVLGVMGVFHSQFLWPVGVLTAISAGRFSGGIRVHLPPSLAVSLMLPLAVFANLGLAWPRGVLGDPPGETLAALELVLRGRSSEKELANGLVKAEALVSQAPRMSRAWQALAFVQLQLGQQLGDGAALQAAVASFRKAQELNPNGLWAYYGEAVAWLTLGQVELGRRAVLHALRLEPNCVRCWLTLAQVRLYTGELTQARAALAKAEAVSRWAKKLTFVSSYEVELARLEEPLASRLRQALGQAP